MDDVQIKDGIIYVGDLQIPIEWLKRLEGYMKTIIKLKEQNAELRKRKAKLEQRLGIKIDVEGFVEKPSLPLIMVGAGYKARPICEEHGEMLRYKHDIWRCEACKTSVDLSQSLRWIREEFDGVVVIK